MNSFINIKSYSFMQNFKGMKFSNFNFGNFFLKSYIFYVLLIWFQDAYLYLEYNLNVQYRSLRWLLPIAFSLLVFYMFRKTISNYSINKLDSRFANFVSILFLLVIFSIVGSFKDTSWDTFNYHLINQEPRFRNFMVESIGEGNFQIWGFRLGDRAFYLFRHILGYRLGTVLNIICAMIVFLQIRSILIKFSCNSNLLSTFNHHIKDLIISIAAIAALLQIHMLNQSGTYMIDILSMPLLLLAIDIIIFEQELSSYFVAILLGLSLAFKLPNAAFVGPLGLILYYRILKNSELKINSVFKICLLGLIVIIPASVYLGFNFQCTNNPVFPYYNAIFKSEYFPIINFRENQWGGQNFIEKLFWVYSAAFNPYYRLAEHTHFYDFVFILGVISLSAYLIMKVFRLNLVKILTLSDENFKNLNLLVLILVTTGIVWGFTSGISRFYMVGISLYSTVFFVIVFNLNLSSKHFGIISLVFSMAISTVNIYRDVHTNLFEFTFGTVHTSMQNIKNNIAEIFKQKQFIDHDYSELQLIPDYRSNGLSYLANKDCPKVYLKYLGYYPNGREILDKWLDKYREISIIRDNHFSDMNFSEKVFIDTLNGFNLYLTDVEDFYTEYGECSKFKVERNNFLKNSLLEFKNDQAVFNISKSKNNVPRYFSAIICRQINDFQSTPFILSIYNNKIKEENRIYSERFEHFSPRMVKFLIPDYMSIHDKLILKIEYLKNPYYYFNVNMYGHDYIFAINPLLQ